MFSVEVRRSMMALQENSLNGRFELNLKEQLPFAERAALKGGEVGRNWVNLSYLAPGDSFATFRPSNQDQ